MDTVSAHDRRSLPLHKRRPLVPVTEPGGSAAADRRPAPCLNRNAKIIRTSPFSCRRCGEPIQWAKINFIREDGAFDWRLDLWCPECGEIRDPEILAAIRDIHLEEVIRGLHRLQDKALGQGLNSFLKACLAE